MTWHYRATARPPARIGWVQRLRLHAGYQWRNNGNPLLTGLRVRWDARGRTTYPALDSELGGVLVSYAGLPEGLAYTLEFTEQRREASSEDAAVRRASTIRGSELTTASALPDGDIVIVGTSAAKARRLPATASVILPMRVHFVLDIDADADVLLSHISKGTRRDFRQQSRKHEWDFGVEPDAEWFDIFYADYYKATMLSRHAERARTEGRDSAYECLFRSGIMFYLAMDGKRVAGHLCHWDPRSRVLTSRLLGVFGGSEKYYAAGALKIMYVRMIEWAARNGVRRLDFQGTEPFLSKGTYQLKRRFGTKVVLPPNHFGGKRLWLQVRRDSPEIRDFLVANPMIAEPAPGRLEAIYFRDGTRRPRLDYQAMSPGVDRIRQVDLDEFLTCVSRCRSLSPVCSPAGTMQLLVHS